MSEYEYVKENYEKLIREIDEYGKLYGRSITVVAVTKSGTDEELTALASAGASDLAENRPTELKRRSELLQSVGYTPRFHEIGNLQRNKVKLIIGTASLIHSVDRYELAEEISRQAIRLGITANVLIEINSARESLKGGVLPEDAEELFLKVRELPGISVKGLMTMGPALSNAEGMRPYFKLTKEIFDKISEKHGFDGPGILSMGMSDSYAVAIEEGSTLIRVGRKLFEKTKGDR
ncbi:MAG: YggS family pyridoxal phosphate-dependent enzyme [Clostridia bacterium]|nr:YggS family pyridoxal phosphate-dependent enzyme [Clostridia bacterium]